MDWAPWTNKALHNLYIQMRRASKDLQANAHNQWDFAQFPKQYINSALLRNTGLFNFRLNSKFTIPKWLLESPTVQIYLPVIYGVIGFLIN